MCGFLITDMEIKFTQLDYDNIELLSIDAGAGG